MSQHLMKGINFFFPFLSLRLPICKCIAVVFWQFGGSVCLIAAINLSTAFLGSLRFYDPEHRIVVVLCFLRLEEEYGGARRGILVEHLFYRYSCGTEFEAGIEMRENKMLK